VGVRWKGLCVSRKTVIAAAVVLGSIALIAGGLAAWKARGIQAAKHAPPLPEWPETVTFATATTAKWQSTADLVGTVIAKRSITVQNEAAGRVESIGFESGAVVNEGHVLLTLDAAQERADLASEQAAVKVAEASVKVAESRIAWGEANMRRMSLAVEGKVASESELDKARTDLDQYRAELDRAKAEVTQAKARAAQVQVLIDKKTIKAPFKARAGLINLHVGQYLAEGSQFVMLQSVGDTINLDFAIPQEHLFRVKPGEEVTAASSVFGAEPVTIKVVAVDAAANPNTRNIRVRGEVADAKGVLRPGMSVDIRVPIGGEQDFVVIPSMAVRRASFGDHVFVVATSTKEGDPAGTLRATQRFVTLGPAIGPLTIVLKGVEKGETVAADGSFKLRDGVMVAPAQEGEPEGSRPAEASHVGGGT
jgi:membrane fusion protein (multidrug efflux system)